MKKIFSFLAVALLSISAMAATITISGSEFTGGTVNTGSNVTLTKSGVTVSTDKGYAAGDHLRVYAGGKLNFSSSETISKIEFEWASSGNKYTGPATETPNATSFTVNADKQMRIANIIITTGGEGGTTGGGTTDDVVTLTGVDYGEAGYVEGQWQMILTNYTTDLPWLQIYFDGAGSKIAGTYTFSADMEATTFGVLWLTSNDEAFVVFSSGTMTIKRTGTDAEGYAVYNVVLDATDADGVQYKLNTTITIYLYDGETDEDITSTDTITSGGTTGGGETGGGETQEGETITVAEALAIGNALAANASTSETYTVVGYVAKIAKDYDTEKKDQCWFMCDDKAEVGADAYFNFEAYWCYIDAPVALGDYVSVTGKLLKYGNTIEIKGGQAKKIAEPMGVTNTEMELKAVKSLEHGTLIIRRGEKTYTILGAQL